MADAAGGLLGTEQEWALVVARVRAIPAYLDTARANLLNGRVAANDYENSLLYVKLSSGSMPQGGPPWTDTDTLKQMFLTNIVRDWIEPEWNASPKPGFSTGAESN